MPDHRKLILLSIAVLAAFFFVEYFFLHDWLPETIPNTPLNLFGLIIILAIGVTFYILFRKILKDNPETPFWYLVVLGFIIGLLSEFIFQAYKQTTLIDVSPIERMRMFFTGVIGIAVCSSIVAVSLAFDMIYKNRWVSSLIGIGLFLLMKLGLKYLGIMSA